MLHTSLVLVLIGVHFNIFCIQYYDPLPQLLSFFFISIFQVVFLSVSSEFQRGMRTICIREQVFMCNKLKDKLRLKLLAVPLNNPKISIHEKNTASTTTVIQPSKVGSDGTAVSPLSTWLFVDKREESEVVNASKGGGERGVREEDAFVLYISLASGVHCR